MAARTVLNKNWAIMDASDSNRGSPRHQQSRAWSLDSDVHKGLCETDAPCQYPDISNHIGE
eukprot:1894028-Rhodomonas_salina.4